MLGRLVISDSCHTILAYSILERSRAPARWLTCSSYSCSAVPNMLRGARPTIAPSLRHTSAAAAHKAHSRLRLWQQQAHCTAQGPIMEVPAACGAARSCVCPTAGVQCSCIALTWHYLQAKLLLQCRRSCHSHPAEVGLLVAVGQAFQVLVQLITHLCRRGQCSEVQAEAGAACCT